MLAFDPVDTDELVRALAVGCVAAAAVATAGLLARGRARAGPLPVGGAVAVVAALVALGRSSSPLWVDLPPGFTRDGSPQAVVAGVGLLLVGGLVAARLRPQPWVTALAGLPGGWLLATEGMVVPSTWIKASVVAATAIGGALLADADRRWSSTAVAPSLLLLSLLGVYVTTPQTAEILVVASAAAPVLVLGWPLGRVRLGRAGALAMTGLLAWCVAVGGFPRPGSIVGGMACLGVVLVAPVVRLLRTRVLDLLAADRRAAVLVVATHGVLVAVASRLAGLQHGRGPAAAIVAGTFAATAVAAVALGPRWRPAPGAPGATP